MLQVIRLITEAIDEKLSQIQQWEHVESFRIFHGRGGCYPGAEDFSVDIFSPAVLITAFKFCDDLFLQEITQALLQRFQALGFSSILFQFRSGKNIDNKVLYGEIPKDFTARYKALRFKLGFDKQNLGYFLDINPARRWLENRAPGARILNLFAYTCAFSVIASDVGAASVVNIDLSAKSLMVGRDNYLLNHLPLKNVHFLPHDIFSSWGKLKRFGPYDIVIIDPPSRQKGSFVEYKDYSRVWQRMPVLVADGGLVLSCLNSPLVPRAEFKCRAQQSLQGFSLVDELEPCESFPEQNAENGLKMLVFHRQNTT